jgi:hypothetical protein
MILFSALDKEKGISSFEVLHFRTILRNVLTWKYKNSINVRPLAISLESQFQEFLVGSGPVSMSCDCSTKLGDVKVNQKRPGRAPTLGWGV